MTNILKQLKGETLKQKRKDSRQILFYNGLKGEAGILSDDLKTHIGALENQHTLTFQVPYARNDVYKNSFFPKTIRDWYALPAPTISSAEGSENCISRFTS